MGTHEATVYKVLGDTSIDPNQLRAEYTRQLGRDLDADVRGDLDDSEWTLAQALLQRNPTRIAAVRLDQAMAGPGTTEATVYEVLGDTTLSVPALRAEYLSLTNRTLDADLYGDLNSTELSRANAPLERNIPRADAVSLHQAMAGAGVTKQEVYDTFAGKTIPHLAQVRDEYAALYGQSLRSDIEYNFGGRDEEKALQLMDYGRQTDAQKLRTSMGGWLGYGSDEDTIRGVLRDRPLADIQAMESEYRHSYGRELRDDLAYDLSGRDEFEALMALEGRAIRIDQKYDQFRRAYEFEHDGFFNLFARATVNQVTSENDRLYATHERVTNLYNQAMADGVITQVEAAQLDPLIQWGNADLETYREVRDAASQAAGTALATAASVSVVLLTSGVSAPVMVVLYSAGAGAVTHVLGRTLVAGDTYGWQELPADFLEGSITGGTGGMFPGTGPAATTTIGAVTKNGLRGLYVGGVSGATAGALMASIDERTWDAGFVNWLGSILQSGAAGGGFGALGGAGAGAFLGLLSRAWAKNPEAAGAVAKATLADGTMTVEVAARELAARAVLEGKLSGDDLAAALGLARDGKWDELRGFLKAKDVPEAERLARSASYAGEIKAGALFTDDYRDVAVLRYQANGEAIADPVLARVNDILGAVEDIAQRRLKQLKQESLSGDATARALLLHADNTACGNIARATDDFIRTRTVQPVQFEPGVPLISSVRQMGEAVSGHASWLGGPKRFAQDEIIDQMERAGPGSSAVVMFRRSANAAGEETSGHFVNVVNIDGHVWLIDAHEGFAVALNQNTPGRFLQLFDGPREYAIPNSGAFNLILSGSNQ